MSSKTPPKGKIQKTANGAVFEMAPAEVSKAKTTGKIFSGAGDVLVMSVGSTTGPWTVTEIRENQKLDPRYAGVDIVVAEHKPTGRTMRMPAATSFRDKAKSAGLKPGDTFAVTREEDYTARGKQCEGYSIIVTGTAKGSAKK